MGYLRDMKTWGIQLKKGEKLADKLKDFEREIDKNSKRAYEDKYPRDSLESDVGTDNLKNYRDF